METFKRLRRLELETPLDVIQERQKNDYQALMSQVNADIVREVAAGDAIDSSGTAKLQRVVDSWPETQQRVVQQLSLGKGDLEEDQRIVRAYFKCVLARWELDLLQRSTAEKRSAEGVRASTIFAQSKDYFAPLMKHLKKKNTPPDLIPMLGEIVKVFTALRPLPGRPLTTGAHSTCSSASTSRRTTRTSECRSATRPGQSG